MKHVRVATYEIKTGTFQEIADKAQDGMLRTFRDQPERTEANLDEIEKKASDNPCKDLNQLVERVRRGYYPFLSPDIQLIPREPNYVGSATSPVHSGPWDYLTHVPLVAYGPGHLVPGEYTDEATMADLAPTTAELIGYQGWPKRDGRVLGEALDPQATDPPKLVVSMVWDGGGWNVLNRWPDAWPFLKSRMAKGTNVLDAIVGSSPSVTPAVHANIGTGAFPDQHGVVDIWLRRGDVTEDSWEGIDPRNLVIPTLADMYDKALDNEPKIAMVGAEPWHLGMIGRGAAMQGGDKDIAVMEGDDGELITNPEFYSLPDYLDDVPGVEEDISAVVMSRDGGEGWASLARTTTQAGWGPW